MRFVLRTLQTLKIINEKIVILHRFVHPLYTMITMHRILLYILSIFVIAMTSSCSDFDFALNDKEDPFKLAVPLINSKISLVKVGELIDDGNSSIRIGADGKVTAVYSGEVIRQDASAIFPAYPGIFPFIMTAETTSIKLPLTNSYLIKNAVFKDTKVRFVFEHPSTQDIKVKLKILEVTKDNIVFERDFVMPYGGTSPISFTSEEISLDGMKFKSNNNSLTFVYEATLPDGSSLKLNKAAMLFDFIKFKYLDGYLGYHVFGIDGSAIDVGLFNNWKSGSFNFEDPKIALSVENAFGVPVRSRINKMELTTVTGNTFSLQSSYINTGIDFAYPSFTEVGAIKTTSFFFDKTNSNIQDVFNEKTKTVNYDIDALINPDKDTLIKGFITDDNFFVVKVVVEVPMLGSVNNFVVEDTFDLNLDADVPDEIEKVALKIITSNDFPADVTFEAFMIDQDGKSLGPLFDTPIKLSAAPLKADGTTASATVENTISVYNKAKIDDLLRTKKLYFRGQLNTTDSQNKKTLWIYDRYSIGIKVGAIVDYKVK